MKEALEATRNDKVSATMRTDFRNGDLYSLPDFMETRSLLSDPNGHGSRNYRHAGAFIDFLVHAKNERLKGKFPRFLESLKKRRGWGFDHTRSLLEEVYGMSLGEIERAWKARHGVLDAMPGGRIRK